MHSSSTRRGLSALAAATALVAGVLGTVTSAAQAATDPATSGKIAMWDGAGGIQLLGADRTGLHHVSGLTSGAHVPNWAPDGSRVVVGTGRQLTTARTTGTALPVSLPPATSGLRNNSASYDDAAFWWNGAYVVFSVDGQLAYEPSDGSWAPEPLLTPSQEPSDIRDVHPTSGPGRGLLAFQRQRVLGAGEYEDLGIWTYDGGTGELKQIIDSGASPVYSADGGKLAFTRRVGAYDQLFTADADGSGVEQVTTDDSAHHNPTWDPAGGRIAYDDGKATRLLDLATGQSSLLTATGTRPAWQPLRKNSLFRIYPSGTTGMDAASSRWTFDTLGGTHVNGLIPAKSAVLVNKASASTAAPAVALAAEKQGPLLLTSATSLDASAAAELKRSLPKGSTVYLEGSTATLSNAVLDRVNALGYKALRLTGSGTDRSSLSVRVAQQITKAPSWVFVADGADYHDPVVAASAAAALGYQGKGVVLLTDGTTVSASVKNFLNTLDPENTGLLTVGSNATEAMKKVSLKEQWWFYSAGGKTHEAVAANVARFWWSAPTAAVVVSNATWQNAVVGGATTAPYGPVLWSAKNALSSETSNYLTQRAASVWSVATFGDGQQYNATSLAGISTAIAATGAETVTVRSPGGTPSLVAAARTAAVSPAEQRPAAGPAAPGERLPSPAPHAGDQHTRP